MRTAIALATILAASGLATWQAIEALRDRVVWDHFDVVKPGLLYRSGKLRPDQLEAAVKQYGIRTVVSFLVPGKDVEDERALAGRLGVDFLNLPMPGDGFGKEEQFREVLAAVDDPHRRPVLIHCARGTCRTGAAVALYRYERDGWTIEDVQAEMLRQVYREGHLPGYVLSMVDRRPYEELYEPKVVHNRNLPDPVPPDRPDHAHLTVEPAEPDHAH